jgi:uncharacterized membrane-anchored protein
MKGRWTVQHAVQFVLVISLSLAALGQEEPQKPVIDWNPGPFTAQLGDSAEIVVPEGFLFTDKKGAQKLLELTQNIPTGKEVGAIIPRTKKGEEVWFVTFEFNEAGFIRDDEKGNLDKNALLKSIQDGTEETNKVRAEKGWPAFHVVAWQRQPYYDQHTNNLTWSILGKDDKGEEAVNHSIRVLGRQGTMNVDVVMGPARYSQVLPQFDQLVGGLKYREGHRYSDYVTGDKVAGYGLTALIAGGAGALAVKTSLLMKMWKFLVAIFAASWKLIVAAFVAILACLKRMFNRLIGRKEKQEQEASTETATPIRDEDETSPTLMERKPEQFGQPSRNQGILGQQSD